MSETDTRTNLIGLSRDELTTVLGEIGEKPFRAKQLWHWLYHQGETDFAKMTSIGKPLQAKLAERHVVARPKIDREQTSTDRTRKWLMSFPDGNQAETVFIPEKDRGAVCVSSQVGCTLTCTFCHTGTQKLVRNLSAAEIVGQFMVARDSYGEWPSPQGERLLSNIVMMGMGEPLFNYDNVVKALTIIMDGEGIALSKRRITLSTSGVVPQIRALGNDTGVGLAISLHAADDDKRSAIMPINKKWPMAELLRACADYPTANNARRITFEYIMLKGFNDSPQEARELARLMKKYQIPAKFNLIPFNPWPGSDFKPSPPHVCKRFSEILNDAGFSAPIRVPRGRDILAACGQLKSDSERIARHVQRAEEEEAEQTAPAS